MFKGPKLSKTNGGLGLQEKSTDAVKGMVCGGVAAAGLALNTPVKLIQPSDAEDLGIDAAYDAANGILVYHHVAEFFRQSPNGTFYLMLVAQGTTLEAMCDIASANNIKTLVLASDNHEIKGVGVVLNPDMAAYAPVLSGGLDGDVFAAIPKAQAIVDDLHANHQIELDYVLIEGREMNGTIAAMTDLHALAKRNVAVIVAQDPQVVVLDAAYSNTAAVGTALGGLAIRKVCESLGSVDIANKPIDKKANENYTLTDDSLPRFVGANLSNGLSWTTLTPTEREVLHDKGYIYAGEYEGYPGVYFNGSHTCADNQDDYSRIERNRTWNKASRKIRKKLIPKMNANVDIDPATGFIKASTVADWEALAQKEVDQMLTDNEVSGVKVKIDPKQNVFNGPLNLKLTVVPRGVAEEITGDIGFALQLN